MVSPTKTLNPLPFEHLEPRRFEDLVRQLAYEFRNWRTLEATGRSGSDEGYDIRGWEIVPDADIPEPSDEDDEREWATNTPLENDREWLFQCKREKSIGPTKLEKYIDEIGPSVLGNLYGLVFACSCDFSKKSRDIFRSKCREAGVSECYIWSRGELEDMLFQPKNDGLLFAYFGISLKIKRRSLKTALRARLATKRKVKRALGEGENLREAVLLRDPEDEKYPYLSEGIERNEHRWLVRDVSGNHPLGIEIEWERYLAFLDEDGVHWDIANVYNSVAYHFEDPWRNEEEKRELGQNIHNFWFDKIDEKCRGIFVVTGLLRFEDIIEIDSDGDTFFNQPHVYVSFSKNWPPFFGYRSRLRVPAISKENEDGKFVQIAKPRELFIEHIGANRVEAFPKKFRRFRN